MNILLTNDDGFYAEGLSALYKKFKKKHCVTVIAPDRERSAVGHGITLYQPLRIKRIEYNGEHKGYSVDGTPADCIKIGIMELLDSKPDLVVSGINSGSNLGININYSGTVAAAREASFFGIPSIAVSTQGHKTDYCDEAADIIDGLIEKISEKGLPWGTFLNVNIPNLPLHKISGVMLCKQGVTSFGEYFEKRIDPRNRTYYWHGYQLPNTFKNKDIDEYAISNNCIAITPIKCDMTDYTMLEDLKNWNINKDFLSDKKKIHK